MDQVSAISRSWTTVERLLGGGWCSQQLLNIERMKDNYKHIEDY